MPFRLLSSDSLKGFGYVFVGVTEGNGAAVGAGRGMFGFCEGFEEPGDL